MGEQLLSVGLDVGTTTTQLIVSRLSVENRASSFAVPEMEIAGRQILYQSPVHFTPLLGKDLVDGDGIRKIVESEYAKAGITPEQVDTGAVIITGETSRKENARAVLDALAELAGDFVVATAGPDLESVLAAKGAGAVELSQKEGLSVLHMDIGGGTSNLAWIADGKIVKTGCMNVGGRLLKLEFGRVSYVSPVLKDLTDLQVGDFPKSEQIAAIARQLTEALEMVAGLREPTELLSRLWTQESRDKTGIPTLVSFADTPSPEGAWVISFSGGVADCIGQNRTPGEFGDMGVELGQAIKKSRLCQGRYVLGQQTIRATVIGAGCYSAQLSGSTVFCRGVQLPVKNLPVAVFSRQEQARQDLYRLIAERLQQFDSERVVLALPGRVSGYGELTGLAEQILRGLSGRPVYVCLEADMAKALGQVLCLRAQTDTPCLCIDRVQLAENSFLDVGEPVGPALPVVVKTLVLQSGIGRSTV